jgi:hypothetical protein
MTAYASAGDGTASSATAGVSIGGGLSRGVERSMTASNASASPPGSAIHPRLRKAETLDREFVRRARRAGEAVAVAAPCRATAISPTRGSHRSVMLCPTTRSRAPPQDPTCGGDRQTDEIRCVFADRPKSNALAPVLS